MTPSIKALESLRVYGGPFVIRASSEGVDVALANEDGEVISEVKGIRDVSSAVSSLLYTAVNKLEQSTFAVAARKQGYE